MKFEKFEVGQIYRTNPYTITLEEIVEFANKFDPHYYHIDQESAAKGLFGDIIASGLHTMSIINREWVKLGILGNDMLGGMGLDAKWLNPVFPNDTIYADVEVINKKQLDEKCGLITLQLTGYNQEGQIWAKAKLRIMAAIDMSETLDERQLSVY